MILTKDIINEIENYLRENIEYFDIRLLLALNTMSIMRCPLKRADSDLYNECSEIIGEWSYDNYDKIEDLLEYDDNGVEFDVEEIIFEIIK